MSFEPGLWSLHSPSLILWSFGAYLSLLFVYRVFFHPLRHFPGDKLAAFTQWHWDYHAASSEYLVRQHARYGPVVRISPNELHFSDPKAYAQIYHTGTKFTKDLRLYTSLNCDESMFSFSDPREAKIRKDVMSPLFSRRAIIKLESLIQDKVDLLVNQLVSYNGQPVNMLMAFRSTTAEIISEYCFGNSPSALTYPGFQHPLLESMTLYCTLLWVVHAFPVILKILNNIPDAIVMRLTPGVKGFMGMKANLAVQIDQILNDPSLLEKADHETIYHHLMTPQPDKGHHTIPSRKSLLDEALVFINAGSDTVGNASTVGTFHVLRNPKVLETLTNELKEAWPEKEANVGYEKLEKLPYLTAVIKEALRLSHGVVTPLPRIVGPSSTEIGGYYIPEGTIVSIAAPFLHDNPDIFTNPEQFDPDRWLQPDSRELETYLVPFSKGPRSCIGVNLAWCELYLILGNVFRKLDMEIYDTTVDDFKYQAFFIPVFTGKEFHAIVKERDS